MTTIQPSRSRTIWIWLLIVVAVLVAISDLLDAARYMGWLPIATLGPLEFVLPSANWVGALLSVFLAGIWLWVAWMLYDLNPSGWIFVVTIAVINLIFLFLALFGANTFGDIVWGVVANAVALIIGVLPSTKQAFLQG